MNVKSLVKGVEKLDKHVNNFYSKHRLFFWLIVGLVMLAWQWPLIFSFGHTTSGDFDYFSQAYEAVRRTILDYHQFPWVNA